MPVSACAGRFGQTLFSVTAVTARLPRQRIWALSLLALLAGCQQLGPTAAAPTSAEQLPAAAPNPATTTTGDGNAFEQSQTYYQVLLGQLAQQRGEPQIALSNLLAAAEASRDIALARQAFGLAMKQRDADATLRAANLLAELEPTNPEARMALALAQFQSDQVDAASVNLDQALALIGSNENGQLALLGKFARAGGPGTLPLLAELARQHPNPEWLLLAAAVQAQHFGDGPYAMALLDRAMEQAPDYRRALLVKAELLANRDGDDAIALLDEAYSKHPKDRELAVAYGRLLYSQGRFREASSVLQTPAKDPADQEASYLYAVSLFMAGEWADALPRLKSIAETGEQTGPAGWLCAQAAERLKQSAAALACYDRVQPVDSQYSPAQRARAELLSKAKRYDDALDGLGEARRQLDSLGSGDNEQKIRQQAGLLASQLRVLQQAQRLADAQALFESEPIAYRSQPEPSLLFASLNQAGPDQVLAAFREQRPATASQRQQWALTGAGLLQELGARQQAYALIDGELAEQPDNIELLYSRALLAETLADHARTEADLRRVLALDPNHVDGLNALGYTLADHNRELDEARDLVQRALRARPTSAAIMDSMGWVHFRRGELEQARDWLQRAYGLEPEAEIAAHYGEVLYRLGEKRKARNLWRDALELDPTNAALKSALERLK